jgi:hypothetical protein
VSVALGTNSKPKAEVSAGLLLLLLLLLFCLQVVIRWLQAGG